jgi:hypothetical protein
MAVKKVWLFASFPAFSGHLVKEFDHAFWVSDLSVNAMTRRCRFPTLPKSALTNLIASSMTGRESFACYRDGDGNVIALDKTGFCVTE